MIIGKAALLVIDVQKGMLNRESKFFSPESIEIIERTRVLIDACRAAGIPIIYTQEIHRATKIDFGRELDGSEGVHALSNSPRTQIADEVDMRPGDSLIPKRRYSSFLYTDLEVVLRGLCVFPNDTLILCGFLTDVCVHYTFVDAHQRDYRLKVVTDCCGGSSKDAHDYALEAMKYLQKDAPVKLEEILKDVKTFKN